MTARILTLCLLTISFAVTCHGDFLSDVPERPQRCSLCLDDEALNSQENADTYSGKTCEQVDVEASQISSKEVVNSLHSCSYYQVMYRGRCCTQPTVSGSSTIPQNAAENLFLGGPPTSDTNTESQPAKEPVLESITDLELAGVRREDPWSDAAKSWPIGYAAIPVAVLALVLP